MGLGLSDSYYRLKARAEVFKALRLDALAQNQTEAAITYGWTAIRIQAEALAVADHDLMLARKTAPDLRE